MPKLKLINRVVVNQQFPAYIVLTRRNAFCLLRPTELIGGLRMASEMARPTVVSFLDIMLRDKEKNLRVEDVPISEGSAVHGKKLGEINLKGITNALLLAVKMEDGSWSYNPEEDFLLKSGMEFILMGSPDEKEKVEKFVRA